jgi:hypothetical protein
MAAGPLTRKRRFELKTSNRAFRESSARKITRKTTMEPFFIEV